MSDDARDLRQVVGQALTGRGAHVLTTNAVDGLEWQLAGHRVDGLPHTIFEILGHLVYWQEFSLRWIDGARVPTPEHAAQSWPEPAAPTDEGHWNRVVSSFRQGLAALEAHAESSVLEEERGEKTVLEILQLIASHNSYHLGQITQLRRILGSWPPPSGGATW